MLRSNGDFERHKQQFNVESECPEFEVGCGEQSIGVTGSVCDLLDHWLPILIDAEYSVLSCGDGLIT